MKYPALFTVCALTLTAGLCGDRTTINNIQPSPVPDPAKTTTRIEFRVSGNVPTVRVRYSDPVNGTNQTVTSLPFQAAFDTSLTSLFLSLDVSSTTAVLISNPFLSAQILVNGNVFRQAVSSEVLPTILISGDWRK